MGKQCKAWTQFEIIGALSCLLASCGLLARGQFVSLRLVWDMAFSTDLGFGPKGGVDDLPPDPNRCSMAASLASISCLRRITNANCAMGGDGVGQCGLGTVQVSDMGEGGWLIAPTGAVYQVYRSQRQRLKSA